MNLEHSQLNRSQLKMAFKTRLPPDGRKTLGKWKHQVIPTVYSTWLVFLKSTIYLCTSHIHENVMNRQQAENWNRPLRDCPVVCKEDAKQMCIQLHHHGAALHGFLSDHFQKESRMVQVYSSAVNRRINKWLCGYGTVWCYHPMAATCYTFTSTITSDNTHLMLFCFSFF